MPMLCMGGYHTVASFTADLRIWLQDTGSQMNLRNYGTLNESDVSVMVIKANPKNIHRYSARGDGRLVAEKVNCILRISFRDRQKRDLFSDMDLYKDIAEIVFTVYDKDFLSLAKKLATKMNHHLNKKISFIFKKLPYRKNVSVYEINGWTNISHLFEPCSNKCKVEPLLPPDDSNGPEVEKEWIKIFGGPKKFAMLKKAFDKFIQKEVKH